MRQNTDNQYVPLPRGWLWIKLDEILERIGNGITQKQTKNREDVPVTRIETISNGVIDLTRVGYLKDVPPEIAEKYKLSLGDILFSHINSDMHLGKTAIFDIEGYTLLHGMNLLLIRPKKQVLLPDFLNYLFNHYRSSGVFISIAQHAVNQSSINQTKMKGLLVPLAPFGEQVRIVARLEELFARLDSGVEGLRKVRAQLKRYRQAVLKYAFEGKLTEEWRNIHKDQKEPAKELLERVKQKEARNQEPLPIEESDLFTLPEDWAWTAFGEISHIKMGQSPSGSSYNNSGHGTPLLNGPTEFGEEHPIAVQWTTSPTKICKKSDLLICVRGNTTGRMNWADQEYCIGRGLAAITPLENIVKRELLFSFLLMKVEEIMRRTRGSTFPNLKSDELYKFPFPLAAYNEQEELVTRMREAFSAARELERNMATSLSQSERLRQSILNAAFEGKLVPQDPSDEPTERLLERVKAEKAKSKGEKDPNSKNRSQLELSTYVK